MSDRGIKTVNKTNLRQFMLSLCPKTLIYDETAVRGPGLPFNGLLPSNPCNYMDY